jgi:CHASE3 domain sensor protein
MKLPFLTKVQKKLILNYTSLLVGLLALPCGFIYYVIKLNTFERSTYLVDHTHQVIHQCDNLEKEVQNIEIGYRAFLATQDSSFLKPFFSGKKKLIRYFHSDQLFIQGKSSAT